MNNDNDTQIEVELPRLDPEILNKFDPFSNDLAEYTCTPFLTYEASYGLDALKKANNELKIPSGIYYRALPPMDAKQTIRFYGFTQLLEIKNLTCPDNDSARKRLERWMRFAGTRLNFCRAVISLAHACKIINENSSNMPLYKADECGFWLSNFNRSLVAHNAIETISMVADLSKKMSAQKAGNALAKRHHHKKNIIIEMAKNIHLDDISLTTAFLAKEVEALLSNDSLKGGKEYGITEIPELEQIKKYIREAVKEGIIPKTAQTRGRPKKI